MNGLNTPCKGCGERRVGCHSGCAKYKAFKERHDTERIAAQRHCRELDAANDVRWNGAKRK